MPLRRKKPAARQPMAALKIRLTNTFLFHKPARSRKVLEAKSAKSKIPCARTQRNRPRHVDNERHKQDPIPYTGRDTWRRRGLFHTLFPLCQSFLCMALANQPLSRTQLDHVISRIKKHPPLSAEGIIITATRLRRHQTA